MKPTPTDLPDVVLLEPRVFEDARGLFYESWNRRAFEAAVGAPCEFVQDNHSVSIRGVLRGLHYQLPNPQAKLVRVTAGEIFDVAVDLRRGSPTFGRWVAERLSAERRSQLWIPEGFAHGFLALSERAEVLYKATAYYHPESERCIRWDDPDLAIPWPLETPPSVSPKDAAGLAFRQAPTFGRG
jgi:dTDP-4-dehydrorhamnose 3,5-epimerase